MKNRKEIITSGCITLLIIVIIYFVFVEFPFGYDYSIKNASKDTTLVYTKNYDSISGNLLIKGKIDGLAQVDLMIIPKGKKLGSLYKINLRPEVIKESLNFDIYDETTVKIIFHHQSTKNGFLKFKIDIPKSYF